MTTDNDARNHVFIVGCGRSGTTALYELLSSHRGVAWFSNYTNKWPRLPQLAVLSLLARARLGRLAPRPVEGYRIFHACRTTDNFRPLTETDISDEEQRCLRLIVRRHLQYQRATTFINKNTRNSRRIRYLNGIFPDARFIHVVRDPAATVASLLHVPWWPDLELWSHGATTPRAWSESGRDVTVLAAEFWVHEVGRILADKEHVQASRYLEVRYEDLTQDPLPTIERVLDFCDLVWTTDFRSFFRTFPLVNQNSKVATRLDREQIRAIERATSKLASSFGYFG